MQHFFTIIGGMGTEATETYLHQLNERTPAQRDQDYLDYILVNHATVPDRTAYIKDHSQPNPLPTLLDDIKKNKVSWGPISLRCHVIRRTISMMTCRQRPIFRFCTCQEKRLSRLKRRIRMRAKLA